MQRIGVLFNPLSDESVEISKQLAQWLHQRGKEVWRGGSREGREHLEDVGCLDLLVALGGDGTVLRAARLAITSECTIPVLPVALGHLNFMSELAPEDLYTGLETLLEGGGWRDQRSLLEAVVYRAGKAPEHLIALNDVVIARGEINRVISLDVEIYDAKFTTYHADGVVVATATGSTAYALSAGGPIVDPRSSALVLVPIAAHLTTIPSLVLHEDATLRLTHTGRYPAGISADGRDAIPLQPGDVIEIKRCSTEIVQFARVYPVSTFYARLTKRLSRS